MSDISLISGCPCSGKTALANALTSSEEKSIHLSLDSFFEFLAHPISPILPESHQQNTSILKSGARAAKALFEDGYRVFVDGVILPWALLVILEEFKSEVPVEYIVLRASLDEELKRAANRKLHQRLKLNETNIVARLLVSWSAWRPNNITWISAKR